MQQLPDALAPLASVRQFVVCKFVPIADKPGKTNKFPVDLMGNIVSAHDPAHWLDAAYACSVATAWGPQYGVGFVFTENDPFWFVDIDNCLQPDNTWSPLALTLCQALGGAAVEVSHSGRGLHIIGTGRPPAHRCKNTSLAIELYHTDRFVALTGRGATGSAAADLSANLPWLVSNYFPPDLDADGRPAEWTEGPCEGWRGPADDADLLRRAMASMSARSVHGGTATFADLWTGNVEALARSYPDQGRAYDASSADAALAQHLAFWTGKDCGRMERLMRQSALVRDKWERADYMRLTVMTAANRQRDVLTDKVPEASTAPPPPVEALKPERVTGATFLSVADQIELFAGCVYVADQHRVLVPGGHLRKPDQFRVIFGGYTFAMDEENERTTRDAWEAFTLNQAYRRPQADTVCFKPDRAPGEIIHEPGITRVNTWWPVEIGRKVGDPGPFLRHLRKLLPNERDADLLLSYMAACVQHKGVKFQWTVVVQGVAGNGKTLFTRCVAQAVGRRYVHWPKASKIAEKFNGWMPGKVFYGVEDIYVPGSRVEILEEMKPMITGGDGLEIEGKGADQVSMDICGNFLLNTNHKDGLRKTSDDRRYANLFTAQQTVADLQRDGMTGNYFPDLYNWLRADGYAIVNELLHTFPIPPALNPALVDRSPITSSTDEAIQASLGHVEQEVLEQIEQETPGFAGGWVSSVMLDRLLERLNKTGAMPRNRRRDMLAALGYHPHPALRDGRTDNPVMPDNGKPRLFVRTGHPSLMLSSPAEVAKAYSTAQAAPVHAKSY